MVENKSAPKVRGTEKVSIEKGIGGTVWKVNVNTGEHLAYISEIPLEHSRGSKSSCAIDIQGFTVEHVIEHEIITDSDTKDVNRAVGLQGLFQGRLLAFIAGCVDVVDVNTREDLEISLGLHNGLQDKSGMVAFGGVEPKSGCDLGEELHVQDRVGETLIAIGLV